MGEMAFDRGLWLAPGLRAFAQARYRRRFRQAFGDDNQYFGVYDSHAAAQAEAGRLSTAQLPASYDLDAAGRAYRDRLDDIQASDYPLVYWLERLFARGARRVFDLGGNVGVSYYAFARYLGYPQDLRWTVHDLPRVMGIGRKWAQARDSAGKLAFADGETDADGAHILLSTGVLQYLPYTLPDLLDRLSRPPPRVLLNLTPMHATREYFTLQNMGFAVCPYRITSAENLVAQMQARGYRVVDRWFSRERHLRIPFHPDAGIEGYSGFFFSREPD